MKKFVVLTNGARVIVTAERYDTDSTTGDIVFFAGEEEVSRFTRNLLIGCFDQSKGEYNDAGN